MTLFEEALFTFLSDAATNAGSRIYPNALPQGATLPAMRYFKVSDPPEQTHSGKSQLRHPRYQVDCIADGDEGYKDAVSLAEQVITAVDGYSGAMSTFTVHAGFRDEMRDNFDPETGRHIVQVDLILWHNKT
jgi:hypothetical protein